MSLTCEGCGAQVLEIDVKCSQCGRPQTPTSAQRMIGNVVLGQYEIVDVLGQGGMSVVYKARHRLTDQEVALKILPPELAAHSQVKSRFLEEAKALALLNHPNIVHLYNFGEDNGCFVLAMQYVQGQTFERMIFAAERLEWPFAVRVSLDVLKALEYAHGRGIVHRDMKPSNVLVRDLDGSATVMDFGIAKVTNSTRLTATGQTLGTVRYMAPEQVRGQKVDGRTDLYALGATLYEALCGDTPFGGDTHFDIMVKHLNQAPALPSTLGVELPTALEAAVMRSLAKRPEDRFQSAAEFRDELERILAQHDPGLAEEMRMRRAVLPPELGRPGDGVPEAMRGKGRSSPLAHASTVAAVPVSGPVVRLSEASATTTGDDVSAPIAATAASPPTGQQPLESPRKRSHESAGRPSGRMGLVLAVAGVVVLLSASVVFFVLRTSSADGDNAPGSTAAAAPAKDAPAPRWPAPFILPDIEFAVDQSFPDIELRVLAPKGWSADRVRTAYEASRTRFVERLERQAAATSVPREPLNITIVPQHVFCDARIYETGNVEPDCTDIEMHYRPGERTLFVLDEQKRLGPNLDFGSGLAICVHSGIKNCGAVLESVAEELEQSRAAKPRRGR